MAATRTESDIDFQAVADRVLLAVRFLAGQPIDEMRETIERAHAIGPFVEPTLYRDALYKGDLGRLEALLDALAPALRHYREEIAPTFERAAGPPEPPT